MTAQSKATPLNVTTYAGNGVYQYERVITTVYALGHEHLDALEAVVNGKQIAADFAAEFERVGVLEAGKLTALGMEVAREAGLEPANGVQTLVADVAAYLDHDAFTSHAAEEAPFAWDAPAVPELGTLDAPEPEYLPQRLPLTTPVLLRNGVSAVVSGNNPNDANRVRVSWWDTHFWVVRHLWTDRVCVEVLPTALETEVASAV